nr:response regulator transcription factor [Saprospiraceae bacterium]
HHILLRGLREELLEMGYRNITTCRDGNDALNTIIATNPDVAILDIEMPALDGFEVVSALQGQGVITPIILLTYHKERSYLAMANRLQVLGYMLKEDAVSDINECIQHVLHGQKYRSQSLRHDDVHASQEILTILGELTSTELAILKLVASQTASSRICEIRQISARTLEKHRSNILAKIDHAAANSSLKDWAMKHTVVISRY